MADLNERLRRAREELARCAETWDRRDRLSPGELHGLKIGMQDWLIEEVDAMMLSCCGDYAGCGKAFDETEMVHFKARVHPTEMLKDYHDTALPKYQGKSLCRDCWAKHPANIEEELMALVPNRTTVGFSTCWECARPPGSLHKEDCKVFSWPSSDVPIEGSFDAFSAAVRLLLEGKAEKKGYNSTGTDGVNPVDDFCEQFFKGHRLGEVLYKLLRFQRLGLPEDLEKAAAWLFLEWRAAQARKESHESHTQ